MCAEEGCGSRREHLALIMKAGAEFAAVGAESLAPSGEPGADHFLSGETGACSTGPGPAHL